MSYTTFILLILILIIFSYQSPLTEPQRVHAEGNIYTCDVCNKSFALHTTIKSHWRTHKQQSQYPCNVYDKVFYDKSNLKKHQRLHTGERPFSCSVCNKYYNDQSYLKKHLHVHSDKSIERQGPPYSRDVCKKGFVFKSNMTQHHQRKHGEGHQFKCDVCNKSFTVLPDLKRHKLLHSEDRRYFCDTCNMSFIRLKNLKAHLFKQTNVYSYSVTCVVKVSFVRVRCKDTVMYIMQSVLTCVKNVISHLLRRII
jgi:KRAB domain-containing zinc finger protein